jgi:hypothetical protein
MLGQNELLLNAHGKLQLDAFKNLSKNGGIKKEGTHHVPSSESGTLVDVG